MRVLVLATALAVVAGSAGCTGVMQSAGGPIVRHDKEPTGPETVRAGVVNGLWDCDPAKNEARLAKNSEYLGALDPVAVRDRCQVRVGYARAYIIPVPIPVGSVILPLSVRTNPRATFSEYVLLPEGWRIARQGIVDDGKTVNVGDIIEVRTQPKRLVDVGIRLIRKCSDPPAPGEPKEWALGCREYDAFNQRGYAGETYFFSVF